MGLDTVFYEVITKDEYANIEFLSGTHTLLIDEEFKANKVNSIFKDMLYPVENEYLDFDKILKKRDKNLKEEDFIIISQCGNKFEFCPIDDWNLPDDIDYTERTKNKITIKVNSRSPKYKVTENVLYVKALYVKRKGANKLFYNDGNWDNSGYITTKKELKEHYEKYFSFYALLEKDEYIPKKVPKTFDDDFKHKILDKFIEGKHIVIYG